MRFATSILRLNARAPTSFVAAAPRCSCVLLLGRREPVTWVHHAALQAGNRCAEDDQHAEAALWFDHAATLTVPAPGPLVLGHMGSSLPGC
jgi:hypothetical protein